MLSFVSDSSNGLALPGQSLVSSEVLSCLELLFCTYKLSASCAQTGMAAYFTCEYMHSLSRELFPNICATDSFDFDSHWVDIHTEQHVLQRLTWS